MSSFTAKAGAFLVAAPLVLLGMFLPLAAAYGAWMRYRYFNEDNEVVGGLNQQGSHGTAGDGGDDDDDHLTEQEEALMMQNTFSRKQKLSQQQNHHGNIRRRNNNSSIADDYSAMMNANSIGDAYKAMRSEKHSSSSTSGDALGLDPYVSAHMQQKQNNNNNNISSSISSDGRRQADDEASRQHKKLIERAKQKLSKQRDDAATISSVVGETSKISSGGAYGSTSLALSDGSDSDSDEDYIPDNYQGGGYFELYGDLSKVRRGRGGGGGAYTYMQHTEFFFNI
jgi:hypothetical protein